MHPTTQIVENHIRISRSLFNEAMRDTESKTYKKAVQKIALVLASLYLIIAFFLSYTGCSLLLLLGESVFLTALLFWLTVMLPGTRRHSKYKALKQGTDRIPERTTLFYQNHLSVISDTGKETTILYDDIRSWQETRHLYILNCNNGICVLLDKNGFVIGNFQMISSILDSVS